MKPKTFAIELRRTSYITFYVEADNAEQAELLAWEELEKHADSLSIEDASWNVESIEEEK